MLVKCFLAYDQHLEDKGIEIDYNKITQADFDSFGISTAYLVLI
jgi:hypothetical protein